MGATRQGEGGGYRRTAKGPQEIEIIRARKQHTCTHDFPDRDTASTRCPNGRVIAPGEYYLRMDNGFYSQTPVAMACAERLGYVERAV